MTVSDQPGVDFVHVTTRGRRMIQEQRVSSQSRPKDLRRKPSATTSGLEANDKSLGTQSKEGVFKCK